MYAIEFQTQTHNGILQIPAQYTTWKNKRVKVILLESETESIPLPIEFKAIKLNTKSYRFNREQANER
jgi:hypothetical protein